MSNVILCYGKYAKNPYYIAEECQNIYSIEELSYYLYRSTYLLDDSFITANLVTWIKNELELPDIADEISKFVGKKYALEKTVSLFIEKVGYYSIEEWQSMIQFIQENDHLTIQEKRKIRADALYHNKKYSMAADEYRILLRETDESQVKLIAKIYHNLGVCTAHQFLFERAAQCFLDAYKTYANTQSYVQFLAAMKMGKTRQEYLTYLAEHPESYEDSLEVESTMERLEQEWKDGHGEAYFVKLAEEKEKSTRYYDEIERLAESAKERFRDMVFKSTNI